MMKKGCVMEGRRRVEGSKYSYILRNINDEKMMGIWGKMWRKIVEVMWWSRGFVKDERICGKDDNWRRWGQEYLWRMRIGEEWPRVFNLWKMRIEKKRGKVQITTCSFSCMSEKKRATKTHPCMASHCSPVGCTNRPTCSL